MKGIYRVGDFGARGNGTAPDTRAVQSAIDSAAQEGGGTVVCTAGSYRCGALFLKRGVDLIVEKDARILGSRNLDDYPIRPTRFEGRTCAWPSALINAEGLSGIRLEGEGTIDGDGEPFWSRFWSEREKAIELNAPFTNRDVMRPRLVFIDRCSDLSVRGLTLRNSAFWNLHLHDGERLLVEDISVSAPHEGVRAASADAVDIDACANVTVRNCTFDTDDDCVCIKGGKGADAHRVNRPTENVLVERCRFGFGHGAVTFGSEACRVRNVVVRDCEVRGENNTVRFKFRDDTDQLFENILFERIEIRDSGWLFDMKGWKSRQDEVLASGLPSKVRNLVVRDVAARGLKSPGIIEGDPGKTDLENIVLENIDIESAPGGDCAPSRHDAAEQLGGAVGGKLTVRGVAALSAVKVFIDGKPMEKL